MEEAWAADAEAKRDFERWQALRSARLGLGNTGVSGNSPDIDLEDGISVHTGGGRTPGRAGGTGSGMSGGSGSLRRSQHQHSGQEGSDDSDKLVRSQGTRQRQGRDDHGGAKDPAGAGLYSAVRHEAESILQELEAQAQHLAGALVRSKSRGGDGG